MSRAALRWWRRAAVICLLGLAVAACRDGAATASTPAVTSDIPAVAVSPSAPGEEVNGCLERNATVIGDGRVNVVFGGALGNRYEPRCILAGMGSEVRFDGDFSSHPLAGGRVVEGELTPDPFSPIPLVTAGRVAVFRPDAPGVYPFYCQVHWIIGMRGAVIVR